VTFEVFLSDTANSITALYMMRKRTYKKLLSLYLPEGGRYVDFIVLQQIIMPL